MPKKAVILGAVLLVGGVVFYMRQRSAAAAADANANDGSEYTDTSTLATIDDWINHNIVESDYLNMQPEPIQQGDKRLSSAGRAKLENFEGFSATPYSDHKGNSIGYGHLIKLGESLTSVTRQQAAEILSKDVAWAENAVNSTITVPLSQGQFDALVSFCFNVGEGAFKRSTLAKRINARDSGAASEFKRWIYASGEVNSALVARREQEQSAFENAYA